MEAILAVHGDPGSLSQEELNAFCKRATQEMMGEDGEYEFSYLGCLITVFCQKGVPQKMKIEGFGRTVYRKI